MTPASRPLRPAHRPASSAIPAFAGMLVAAAFAMGAFAFEVGAGSALEAVDPAPVVTVEPSITPSTTDVFVEPVPVVTPSLSAPRSGPMIALVIDDAGPDRLETLRAMALPVPVTLSILPYAEDAAALDEQARSLGHETFIHLPMEPEGLADPGPHAITRHQSVRDQQARVAWAISRIPGATGLNNHMGSAITADRETMRSLLQPAQAAGLIFLDSLTSPRSRAKVAAQALGMTALNRDIFLDHQNDPASIRRQLSALETLASERGAAIAIGHPRLLTMDALEDWVGEAEARGFQFVTISTLVEAQANTPIDVAALGEGMGVGSSAE